MLALAAALVTVVDTLRVSMTVSIVEKVAARRARYVYYGRDLAGFLFQRQKEEGGGKDGEKNGAEEKEETRRDSEEETSSE